MIRAMGTGLHKDEFNIHVLYEVFDFHKDKLYIHILIRYWISLKMFKNKVCIYDPCY